jgi:hypothetical protein
MIILMFNTASLMETKNIDIYPLVFDKEIIEKKNYFILKEKN